MGQLESGKERGWSWSRVTGQVPEMFKEMLKHSRAFSTWEDSKPVTSSQARLSLFRKATPIASPKACPSTKSGAMDLSGMLSRGDSKY